MALGSDATPIDAATEVTGGFGSLKAVLGAIPAVYSNREVRFRPPTQNSLPNASAGIRRHRRQYRNPALTYRRTGDTLRNKSRRRGRTEAAG